jgi:hypothetical protein
VDLNHQQHLLSPFYLKHLEDLEDLGHHQYLEHLEGPFYLEDPQLLENLKHRHCP